MKVKAIFSVEFELAERQPENAAVAALARGRGGLIERIGRGIGAGPTGVKRGSVKADIISSETAE